ncbi:hypothetical protein ACIGXM_26980 [Kitasatospora sp. NPDC052896]|uniref:hypothetical protein n=1 Tax=Kitasatospora sp. NPDC052896 TaxID=3364061 RepID=UPI0037C53CE5
MAAENTRPRRELVIGGPGVRRTPAPRPPVAPPAGPVDPAVAALMRRQLRAALGGGAALGVLVVPLPLLFALAPGLAAVRVVGVPLVWLLLGVLGYPVLWLIGRWYVTRAERNETR